MTKNKKIKTVKKITSIHFIVVLIIQILIFTLLVFAASYAISEYFRSKASDAPQIVKNIESKIVEKKPIVLHNEKIKSEYSIKQDDINKLLNKNLFLSTTLKKSNDDILMEDHMIESIKIKYFQNKDKYSQNEYKILMNSYFVKALQVNNWRLADVILLDSGAKIEINEKSKIAPKISPLMAVATASRIYGGDINYFKKLVGMGAKTKELTKKYKVPLISLAATVNNYKIVLFLAVNGANIMHLDDFDFYPLDYAVRNDSYESAIILINIINKYKDEIIKKRILSK